MADTTVTRTNKDGSTTTTTNTDRARWSVPIIGEDGQVIGWNTNDGDGVQYYQWYQQQQKEQQQRIQQQQEEEKKYQKWLLEQKKKQEELKKTQDKTKDYKEEKEKYKDVKGFFGISGKLKDIQAQREQFKLKKDRAKAEALAKAQAEYDLFFAEQEKLLAEIDELEKQEKELEEQIAKQEAEKERIEKEEALIKEFKDFKRRHGLNADYYTYDERNRKIKELQEAEKRAIEALGKPPSMWVMEPVWEINPYTGKRLYIKYYRKTITKSSASIAKGWYVRRDAIRAEYEKKIQNVAVDYSNYPDWMKAKVKREWNSTSYNKTSALQLLDKWYTAKKAKEEQEKQSSITNAKSEAIKEREAWEKLKLDFKTQRDETQTALNEGQTKILESQTKQIALKKRPEIKDTSFFKSNDYSVIPKSIIGTTYEKSFKALQTYQTTQQQQKELHQKVTKSASVKEALDARRDAMRNNPYVGTANVWMKNGAIYSASGVLIERKLNKKFDTDTIESDRIYQNYKANTYEALTSAKSDLKEIQDTRSLLLTTDKPGKIPEYIFLDGDGNAQKVTAKELWQLNNYLLEQHPKEFTQTDKENNFYIQQNLKQIEQAEKEAYPQLDKFDQQSKQGGALDIFHNNPFEKGFIDHANEIGATLTALFGSEKDKERLKQHPNDPTLEGLFLDDIIERGKEIAGFGDPNADKDKSIQKFKELWKTDEGKQKIAGSIAGSVILGASYVIVPGLAVEKYLSKVVKPKTLEKVAPIVEALKETKQSKAVEKMLEKYPTMPAKMKQEILKNSETQKIVGVEMLDPKTVLITRGTETSEELTPFIVAKVKGKNPRASLYQTFDYEKPGQYKEILLSGKQNKELYGGKQITKDVTAYPANRDNILKASDPKTSTEYLASIGVKKDVLLSDLKKYPKATIQSVEKEKVKSGSVMMETQRENPLKQVNKKAQGLPEPDSMVSKLNKVKKSKINLNKALEATKPTAKNERALGTLKENMSDLGKKTKTVTQKKNAVNQRKEQLKEMIKKEYQGGGNDYITVLPGSSAIAITHKALQSKVKPIANTIDLTLQTQKEDVSLKLRQNQIAVTQAKQEALQKTKQIEQQKEQIKTDLVTVQDYKSALDPRWSLIVDPRYKQKQGHPPRYIVTEKQETILRNPPKVPPTRPPTRRPPPGIPGIKLDLPGDPPARKEKMFRSEKGINFWRWNVNTNEVGQYLPTADIHTGKTKKVIQKVDALEKRVGTKKYKKQQTRKEERFFKLGKSLKRNKKKDPWRFSLGI